MNRNAPPDALAAALTALSHGLEVTDPALSPSSNATAPTFSLTPRENEVLRLLGEGLSKKIVASQLNVSQHTVKFHVNSIMGKLNA